MRVIQVTFKNKGSSSMQKCYFCIYKDHNRERGWGVKVEYGKLPAQSTNAAQVQFRIHRRIR